MYYMGLAGIAAGLFYVWQLVEREAAPEPIPPTAFILFAGVVVALISIVATNISQWRAMRVQQTFAALQTLRTDREYLINALKVEAVLGGTLGEPLSPEKVNLFLYEPPSADVQHPSFSQAARFLLNQYEFIAAATRQGLMDEEMLRNTTRSGFCSLVRTFSPVIAARRRNHPDSLANLIWLYRRMSGDDRLPLGPRPRFVAAGWLRLGRLIGIVPDSRR